MVESFIEPFNRMQPSREPPTAKVSAQQTTRDRSSVHSPEQTEADEEAVLQEIEERARRYPGRERSFRFFERLLDRVVSDNALEAYKRDRFSIKTDSDLLFLLLDDLEAALSGLETFKDRLPNRYQANVNKVLNHTDRIKQIFHDYHLLREKGEGRGPHDVGALLTTLDELRKIDPDRFPADLIDVTDEERERDRALRNITLRSSE